MATASWLERLQDGMNRRVGRRVGLFVKIIVPAVILFVLFSAALGFWVASSSRRALLAQSAERTGKQFAIGSHLLQQKIDGLLAEIANPILLQKVSPLIEKGMVDHTSSILADLSSAHGVDFIHAYDKSGKFLVSSAKVLSYQEQEFSASLARELAARGKGAAFLTMLPRQMVEFEGLQVSAAAGAAGESLAIVAFAAATDDFGDPIGYIMAFDILTGDQRATRDLAGLIGADVALVTAAGFISTSLDASLLGQPVPAAMAQDLGSGQGKAAGTYRVGAGTFDVAGEWVNDRQGKPIAALIILNPVDSVLAQTRSLRNGVMLAGVLILGAFAAVLGVILKTLLKTVDRTVVFMESVAAGNLSGRVEARTRDELEVLSEAINSTVGNLRTLLRDVEGSFSAVEQVTGTLVDMAAAVDEGAVQGEAAVRTLDGTTATLTEVVGQVVKEMVAMLAAAEKNLTSLNELSLAVDTVAKDAESFATHAGSTGSAIQQSSSSITEVTNSVKTLTRYLEQASAAMGEIDSSIRRIRELTDDANETSRALYESAVENGRGAMARARGGMDSIEEIISTLGETVRRAGAKSEEIGEIVDIISSIASQTSLLALNASILAAQAGEEGKGFAVVADEIRSLSGKTHQSIKDIADRIAAIQKEGRDSVEGVEKGIVAVRGGAGEVKRVETVLEEIIAGVTRSRELSGRIAEQTRGQAQETEKASKMLMDVSGMATEIAAAMNQQEETGRYIQTLSEEIGQKAESMRVLTDQQSAAVKGIRVKTQETTVVADALSRRADGVRTEMTSVREVIEVIGRVTRDNRDRVGKLREAVELLGSEADKVRTQIGTFKLDA